MRGDRPAVADTDLRAFAATPHARGSTLRNGGRIAPHHGYPACAGIDRSLAATRA